MPDGGRTPVGWRLLARLLPREFRERHRDELEAAAAEHLRRGGVTARARAWIGLALDTVRMAVALRWTEARRAGRRRGGAGFGDALRQDFLFGFRALRRRPGFTVVSILTLAVGIGAVTAIFSVVHGVLLRPLPYRAADRIGIVWHEFGNGAQNLPALHPLDLYDYRERSRLVEDFTLASGREWILGGPDDPELVDVATVEAGFFDFFGVSPLHGRGFTPEEDVPGAPRVVVLSHRLWQRRYGADPGVVGRPVEVEGESMEVVGVLPASFRLSLPAEAFLLRDAELWTPARVDPERLPPRNYTGFTGFARLGPGVGFAEAQEEVEALAARLRAEHPVHASSNLRARLVPLHRDVVKGSRRALLLLLGGVGLLLVVACANVAGLALVRGQLRERELSVRAAVGAGRSGLTRLVLAESLVVSGAGVLAGTLLAAAVLEALPSLAPADVPRLDAVGLHPVVLAVAAAAGLLSALLFGAYPALRAARRDPAEALGADDRGGTGREAHRFRDLLVATEVAASLVLLVATGLVVRSFHALGSVDPGYAVENVLTFRVNLPDGAFDDDEARRVFADRLFASLGSRPGVEAVAGVSQLPLTGSGPLQPYAWNEETAAAWESVTADGRRASPGFFGAVGARLLSGRDLTADDARHGARIVIDDRLARRAFPGVDPVGRLLQVNPDDAPEHIRYAEVVGVVEHLRLHDLGGPHLTQIWFPMAGSSRFSVVVRTAGDPAALAPVVRSEVARLAPGAPVEDVRTMAEITSRSLAPVRLTLGLVTAFAVVALLLAVVGVYGVLSFTVSRRTREIGVRMALGQAPAEVRRQVVGRGLRLTLAGVAAGLAAAALLSRSLAGLLYEVEPTDPATYAATAMVVTAAALLASWLPARRATRIDPAAALRE